MVAVSGVSGIRVNDDDEFFVEELGRAGEVRARGVRRGEAERDCAIVAERPVAEFDLIARDPGAGGREDDVEAIRGVACGEMIRSLMYKGLVKIVGKAEILGRPLLYGTTKKFLEVFGLSTLKDLPKVEELKEPSKSENNS